VPPDLDGLLKQTFGFPAFREGQREAIQALLEHNAALAVFPTGGGKSLCYQLPALAIEGVTLVVSPLIALMKDQIDFLTRHGIPAARLDSSLSFDELKQINDRLRSGELKILYVAPERFNNERFLGELHRLRIGLFAVDEAHCISEWGHNFRPDYLKLADTARAVGAERVLALTATATASVVADICKGFQIPEEAVVLTGFYRHNLTLLTTPTTLRERNRRLIDRLRERPSGATIVYVTLQKTAEQVAALLQQEGFAAEAYHAGMKPEERTAVQDRWMARPGGIVVATIAFGMGIDKADVRYVYHYNMPKSLESYSQEIGRAGRDDKPSTVEMLACANDLPVLENFVYGDTPSEESLRSLVESLLGQEEEFALSQYETSNQHDLRPLVLRTALTYLELLGAIRRGTPFYAGYEFRPLVPTDEVFEAFPGQHGEFVRSLFGVARRGRTWFALDPDKAAEALEAERKRVVRALEVMAERGLVELRSSDVRDRYTRLVGPDQAPRLVAELDRRFQHRERAEIERLKMVPELVEQTGCQTNALVGYFGEQRSAPCGHCSYCLSGAAQKIPAVEVDEPLAAKVSRTQLATLLADHPAELGTPRRVAKFLCGLSSPRFTSSRLSRNPLFGIAESVPFQEVVAFAEGSLAAVDSGS
jgi:ATP-dependent DNA helicase RecQ